MFTFQLFYEEFFSFPCQKLFLDEHQINSLSTKVMDYLYFFLQIWSVYFKLSGGIVPKKYSFFFYYTKTATQNLIRKRPRSCDFTFRDCFFSIYKNVINSVATKLLLSFLSARNYLSWLSFMTSFDITLPWEDISSFFNHLFIFSVSASFQFCFACFYFWKTPTTTTTTKKKAVFWKEERLGDKLNGFHCALH